MWAHCLCLASSVMPAATRVVLVQGRGPWCCLCRLSSGNQELAPSQSKGTRKQRPQSNRKGHAQLSWGPAVHALGWRSHSIPWIGYVLITACVLSHFNHVRLFGPKPARLLYPWDSPGKNTGLGCHVLLQGVFPTQGSNPCLFMSPALAGRQFLNAAYCNVEEPSYPLSHVIS